MVKPRRPSKRLTTAHRAKVARKVREHNRKQRKNTIKKKKRADPGIPKELPFYAKILEEAQAAKARKQQKSALQADGEMVCLNSEDPMCLVENGTGVRNKGAESKIMSDPIERVREEIWKHTTPEALQNHYHLQGDTPPSSLEGFLRSLAFSIGRLLKGGIPNVVSAAQKVLADAYKLPLMKPKVMTPTGSVEIVTSLAPEFNLDPNAMPIDDATNKLT